MSAIFTVEGRKAMDLVHHVSRGNRRFALIGAPQTDMRGFIVEMRRLTPTAVRGQSMIEVTACDRYVADRVFIPEERRGLYINESEALRFANGQIVKDQELQRDLPWQELLVISEKLRQLEKRFQEQFRIRADPE
jgi:hypothetical protein